MIAKGSFDIDANTDIPEGWGFYGIRRLPDGSAEVWFHKLPLPEDLARGWPEKDGGGTILGRGAGMRAARAEAVAKIKGMK